MTIKKVHHTDEEEKGESTSYGDKVIFKELHDKGVKVLSGGVVEFGTKRGLQEAFLTYGITGVTEVGLAASGIGSVFGEFIGTWLDSHSVIIQIFNFTSHPFVPHKKWFNSGRLASEEE